MSGLISTDHSVLDYTTDMRYASGMDYIDYTQITHNGQPRRKITRDEFLQECAAGSKSTVEQVEESHRIEPCDCGELDCPGWKATYILESKRRRGKA